MLQASPFIITCVVTYLAAVLAIGFYLTKKRVKSSDDFAVANRSLPTVVLIGTLLATWCGAGGITGSANLIWRNGPLFGILIFMGAPIGMMLLYLVSGRVREATTYTIPELFEIRYGTAARVIATTCIVLGYVGILSSQFKAAGSLINLTTGMNVEVAIVISGLIMLLLAVTGGMVSVAYTDAVSAFLFVGGFIIALPALSGQVEGGFFGVFQNLPAGRNSFMGSLTVMQALGYIFPIFFLILGDQNMIQRMGAARDTKTARQSALGLVAAEILVCALIIMITTTGIYLLPNIDRPDTVIFQLAIGFLPPLIGGLVMAACMAFIITTGDSYVLTISSNITYDIWNRFLKRDATDREKLAFLRISAVGVAALAYMMGRFFPDILSVQMYAYSMYGASVTPALICALFSKNVTKAGGVCGILVGGIGTLIWEIVLKSPYGIKSAILTVPLSFAVIYIVSAFTQKSGSVPLEVVYRKKTA